MDAVLRVDLEPGIGPGIVAHDLVDAGRAVALLRRVVLGQVDPDRDRGVLQRQVGGWFSSWLVLEMNTEDSLSKVSTPSGLGYLIFGASLAFFN